MRFELEEGLETHWNYLDKFLIFNFAIFNFQSIYNDTMTQFPNTPITGKYDLEERTAKFGENVIALCKSLKQEPILTPLISQIVRSATSVGANYMEANGASSKKDFQNKIFICKKEIQETKHWLRMIVSYAPEKAGIINPLRSEAQEPTLIFQKIGSTLQGV